MNVILAGPDRRALKRTAYPAFAGAGFSVLTIVDTLEGLGDMARHVDLTVVDAALASTPAEAVDRLSDLGASRLAVILPTAWSGERERFGDLPGLVAGYTAPPAWAQIAAGLSKKLLAAVPLPSEAKTQDQPSAEPLPKSQSKRQAPASSPNVDGEETEGPRIEVPAGLNARARQVVRVGFYGARGGVGTSSAALAAALALAGGGHEHVGLFDAAGRGDLHLMAGLAPGDGPGTAQSVTFFLEAPTEALAEGFDAVVIDGGRKRGNFNAEWIEVARPLDEHRVRQLVGLAPKEPEAAEKPQDKRVKARRGNLLGGLISLEVTE